MRAAGAERRQQLAAGDRLVHAPVGDAIQQRGHAAVRGAGRVRGQEDAHVMRQSHPGARLQAVDRPVGAAVGQQHLPQDLERPAHAVRARRERFAAHVTAVRIDDRLVDRTPQRHLVAQRLDDARCEAGEKILDLGILPRADLGQPQRVGEVVQRDHRLDAAGAQQADHLGVLAQAGLVEQPRLRLDPAPLDRQAQAVDPELGRPVEVGRGGLQVPPVGRPAGFGAVMDAARLLLPRGPLVVAVAALVLVRGGRNAPQEAVGHFQDGGVSHWEVFSH